MSSGPRSVNTIAIAWEQWMADVMQDSASHTEISATLGRNVAKPLLEKTFHMKIQSRKVFKQREAFERMINENEDRTTKSHITGKAGLTMLSNKTPTASPSTLKVITDTSDRFTTSTE